MPLENSAEFLRELTKLTLKYRISIHACGCCQSPWLSEQNEDGHYEVNKDSDRLQFVRDK